MGMLDGKVAIVTGAGHGVGRGEALELAAQGAKVVVNDLGGSSTGEGADSRAADEVAALIRDRGGEAVASYDDVADFDGARAMVHQAIDTFGKLDVLVNNAGILRDRMIFSMTEEDFDSVIRVHLKGTWAPSHHAAVYWREQSKAGNQPRASIINTSSGAGLQGNAGQTNYASAKAGIAAMTITLSLELARYGVRANVVCPGGMTRLAGTIVKDLELKEPEEYTEFTPMNPANSAPMVVFLAVRRVDHDHRSGVPRRRRLDRALPAVDRRHRDREGRPALGAGRDRARRCTRRSSRAATRACRSDGGRTERIERIGRIGGTTRPAVRGHRCGDGRHPQRDQADRGRLHRSHRVREGRSCRRHVAREHLSRHRVRRAVAPLPVLVRAQPRLEPHVLAG